MALRSRSNHVYVEEDSKILMCKCDDTTMMQTYIPSRERSAGNSCTFPRVKSE